MKSVNIASLIGIESSSAAAFVHVKIERKSNCGSSVSL